MTALNAARAAQRAAADHIGRPHIVSVVDCHQCVKLSLEAGAAYARAEADVARRAAVGTAR